MCSGLRLMFDFAALYEVNRCSGGRHKVKYVEVVFMI